MSATPAWWPIRKIRKALAAYLTVEAAAVVGELTTGTPGWQAVLVGGILGGVGLVTAYLTNAEAPA